MGEAIVNNLSAVGIRTRMRTMERAAFLTVLAREEAARGARWAPRAPAATPRRGSRAWPRKGGLYAYGVIPEVEDLFQRQARELDRKKREEMLHQIQRILADRVVFAPIWENAFLNGVGPRVDEAALTLVTAFPYTAPFDDLRLKR